ncbi:MAG: Gfo/Idh/MocA family oxidoreductase [Candidatus Thorarchaeota archaeon]|nr:Gfo/Idh/MocA family oxidoreductase [Candidatus Thorarchaeota archaeon]
MTDKVLKTVCAGVGFVGGAAHVPSFRKVPNSQLYGLLARKGRESEKFALKMKEKINKKESRDLKIYYSWDDVCSDPEVDAVCVATPTPFHYPMGKQALEAGKHVYLEMPIAPKLEDAEELGKIAKEKGVVLMPILNFRHCPGYNKAKELMENGAIGDPIAITFREFIAAEDLASQWPLSGWAWDIEKAGGYPDYTLSVWSLDMFRWFFNTEIEDMRWTAHYKPIEGINDFKGYQTVGIIKFSNGVVGTTMVGSTVAKGLDLSRFEILGNNGKTLLVDWVPAKNREVFDVTLFGKDGDDQNWQVEGKGPLIWGHKQLITHFVQACIGNEKPGFDYKDAIAAQKWSNKIVTDLM